MTCKEKASYDSKPPCSVWSDADARVIGCLFFTGHFPQKMTCFPRKMTCKEKASYDSLLRESAGKLVCVSVFVFMSVSLSASASASVSASVSVPMSVSVCVDFLESPLLVTVVSKMTVVQAIENVCGSSCRMPSRARRHPQQHKQTHAHTCTLSLSVSVSFSLSLSPSQTHTTHTAHAKCHQGTAESGSYPYGYAYEGMLQCVAVCCSALQCVAVRFTMWQCILSLWICT